VRQAQLGASCRVHVPAEAGPTNHAYRVVPLSRRCTPNDTGAADPGHHGDRRRDRTLHSLRPPRDGHQADGEGLNAPEANPAGSVWCDPRGSVGVHTERGMPGAKRQEHGRPSWCLGRERQGDAPEHTARGREGHEGVRAAQSPPKRESRSPGAGADSQTELAPDTWPDHAGSDDHAHRPARQSTAGETPAAVSVAAPLWEAQGGLVARRRAGDHAARGRRRGPGEGPSGRAPPGGPHPAPGGASQEPKLPCHTRQTTLSAARGGKRPATGDARGVRDAGAAGGHAVTHGERRAGRPALSLWLSAAWGCPCCGRSLDDHVAMGPRPRGGRSGPPWVLRPHRPGVAPPEVGGAPG
jgi:hypothetical protein